MSGNTKRFRPWEPGQAWLLPPSLTDFVPADHPAHFVRELVREQLDPSEVFAAYSTRQGQPPFHPTIMTALLLFAYTQAVLVPRRRASACEAPVDCMARTGIK